MTAKERKSNIANSMSTKLLSQTKRQWKRTGAIFAILTSIALVASKNPAVAGERVCTLMAYGIAQTTSPCKYSASGEIYSVKTKTNLYQIDARKSKPVLLINGKKQPMFGWEMSSVNICEIDIALAKPIEPYNIAYENYPKLLCLLHEE